MIHTSAKIVDFIRTMMMAFQNPNEFWSKIAAADGLSRCFLLIPGMMSSIPATHKERMEPMRTRRI